MTRLKRSRSNEKHSGDDEETVRERKRRKFLDFAEGKKSKSINGLQNLKMVNHKDGGDRNKGCFRNREEEKPAKENQQSQMVVSATQHNGGNACQGFGRLNRSYKQEDEFRRSKVRNNFCRRLITRSSVKTGPILKEISLDNPMITTNDESKLNEDNMSLETTTKISKPSLPTSSLSRRPSNRSSASYRIQVRAFHGKSTRRIRAGQSRAAQLRLCSICNKNFPNLFTVPGYSAFLCSVCRRKSKAVDSVSSLNIDFQTHIAESPGSGQKQQSHIRERDITGRTPDTAVEIDSSDEEEEAVNRPGSAMKSREEHCQADLQLAVNRIAYPSRTDPEAIEILASDIERLEPLEFLNDTIIDFYIKYIQREFLGLEAGSRFHFFNSFFYKKLSVVAGKKVCKKKKKVPDFSKLRKWTRGINIFEKDYLIIPVHDKLHWSLAIICFPNHGPGSASRSERCILHLDSMTSGHESLTIFRLLRRYLVAEWKDTFGRARMIGDDSVHTFTCNIIPGKKVQVPLQENESDCGLFLLHYIRKFVESSPRSMKMSDVDDRLEGIGVFGRQWFSPIEASNLRTSIREQLQRLFAENERVLGMSSDTSFENHDVVKPRNLEAEFRVYL